MKWLSYFRDAQKQQAMLGATASILEYGQIIYRSSEFLDRRWLVTKYLGEFNVFVEYTAGSKRFERLLAASFATKERAIAFAAEMFLICCGRVKRKNRHCLTDQGIASSS